LTSASSIRIVSIADIVAASSSLLADIDANGDKLGILRPEEGVQYSSEIGGNTGDRDKLAKDILGGESSEYSEKELCCDCSN
jgi:hypothetical protein